MFIKTALEKGRTERNGKRTSKNSGPSFNIPLLGTGHYLSPGGGGGVGVFRGDHMVF